MTKIKNLLLLTIFWHFTVTQSSQPTREISQPLLIVPSQDSAEEQLHRLETQFSIAHPNSCEELQRKCRSWTIYCCMIPLAFWMNYVAMCNAKNDAHTRFYALLPLDFFALFSLGQTLLTRHQMHQEQKHFTAKKQLEEINRELTQNFTPQQIARFLARNNVEKPFYNKLLSTFNVKQEEIYENGIKTSIIIVTMMKQSHLSP